MDIEVGYHEPQRPERPAFSRFRRLEIPGLTKYPVSPVHLLPTSLDVQPVAVDPAGRLSPQRQSPAGSLLESASSPSVRFHSARTDEQHVFSVIPHCDEQSTSNVLPRNNVSSADKSDMVCGAPHTGVQRLVHPLDEGTFWEFVGSFTVVLLCLSVGICVTLLFLVLYGMIRILRSVCVLFCRDLRCYSFRHRLRILKQSISPYDIQWLHSGHETQSIHHATLFFNELLDRRQFCDAIADALHQQNALSPKSVQRLYQRVFQFSMGYSWVLHDGFLIEDHILAGPTLSTAEDYESYLAEHLRRDLTQDRPLWEMILLPVLDSGGTLVLIRVHRAVSDGMGLLRLFCHALIDRPYMFPLPNVNFGSVTYPLNVFRAFFYAPIYFVIKMLSQKRHRYPKPSGQQVDVCMGRLSWKKINMVRQVTKHSVHEILSAVSAGAVRSEIRRTGIFLPPNVSSTCPVDLRSHDEFGSSLRLRNCSVHALLDLPCGVEGSIPRLWAARRIVDSMKTSADTAAARLLINMFYSMFPTSWAAWLTERIAEPPACVQIANLAGPDKPVQLAGYQVQSVFPTLAPSSGGLLTICAMTYDGHVHVCVTSRRNQSGRSAARRLMNGLKKQLNVFYKLLKNRKSLREHLRNRQAGVDTGPLSDKMNKELQMKLVSIQGELQALKKSSVSVDPHDPEQYEGLQSRIAQLKTEFRETYDEMRRQNIQGGESSNSSEPMVFIDGAPRKYRRQSKATRRLSSASSTSSRRVSMDDEFLSLRRPSTSSGQAMGQHFDPRVAPSITYDETRLSNDRGHRMSVHIEDRTIANERSELDRT